MKFAQLLILSLFVVTTPAVRANFVVVDNFTTPAVADFAIIGPGPNPALVTGPTGIGSTRTSTFIVNIPTPPNSFDLIVQQGAGRLDFNSSVFARAQANLFYDNFTGGTGNLTSSGTPFRILLSFNNIDPGINLATGNAALDMPVDIAIATSGGTAMGSFFLTSTNVPNVYALPLSSFTGIADYSNLTSINVNFNGGTNQRQAVDFVLTNFQFETAGGTLPVPAPPALLMAMAGLPVLGLVRRFRRS